MGRVIEEESRLREDRHSKRYEPFRLRTKMDKYSQLVRDTMKPEVSEKKRKEMEELKQRANSVSKL